jgi:hypothetical protein
MPKETAKKTTKKTYEKTIGVDYLKRPLPLRTLEDYSRISGRLFIVEREAIYKAVYLGIRSEVPYNTMYGAV